MRYEDLKELGSEAAVKAAGKYITKGKEYEVQVFFLSFQILADDVGRRYMLLEVREEVRGALLQNHIELKSMVTF